MGYIGTNVLSKNKISDLGGDVTTFAKSLLDDVTRADQLASIGISTYVDSILTSSDVAARSTISAAKSGDNTDITSLASPYVGPNATATDVGTNYYWATSETKVANTRFVKQHMAPLESSYSDTVDLTGLSSYTFSGLPTWKPDNTSEPLVKRITALFDNVTTNGTSRIIMTLSNQANTAGSSYLFTGHSSGGISTDTNGVGIFGIVASVATIVPVVMFRMGQISYTDYWTFIQEGTYGYPGNPYYGAGHALVAGVSGDSGIYSLTVTTIGGTSLFTGGTITLRFD